MTDTLDSKLDIAKENIRHSNRTSRNEAQMGRGKTEKNEEPLGPVGQY